MYNKCDQKINYGNLKCSEMNKSPCTVSKYYMTNIYKVPMIIELSYQQNVLKITLNCFISKISKVKNKKKWVDILEGQKMLNKIRLKTSSLICINVIRDEALSLKF